MFNKRLHTMTKQQIMSTQNKQQRIREPIKKSNLILLLDDVGLTEILKDQCSSSGPKERLECLDYSIDETEKYYLSF